MWQTRRSGPHKPEAWRLLRWSPPAGGADICKQCLRGFGVKQGTFPLDKVLLQPGCNRGVNHVAMGICVSHWLYFHFLNSCNFNSLLAALRLVEFVRMTPYGLIGCEVVSELLCRDLSV